MRHYLRYLRPMIPLAILVAALWLLFHEVRHYHYRDVVSSLAGMPPARILGAVALTVINYLILVGYDWIAMRYLQHPLGLGKIALASFVSYVCSFNFGVLLGGTGVRYRIYSEWGLSGVEIVKLVAIVGLTFWIGLIALASVVFVVLPLEMPAKLHLPIADTRILGGVLFLLMAIYLSLCLLRKAPLSGWGWSVPVPPLGLALMQIGIAASDLMVAAGVLFVLLPTSATVGYPQFLSIYLLAVLATAVTNVPGGLGVFELTVILLLPAGDPQRVLGALLLYRVIYYLLPLVLAALLMAVNEFAQHRHLLVSVGAMVHEVAPAILPRLISFAAFLAGAVLLLTGAFPTPPQRLQWVKDFLPLTVFETSHFIGSLVGVMLLVVARSLSRRLDSAFWAAVVMLVLGILVAMLRGFDYEEATLLFVVLLTLLPCRRQFYRKGSLLAQKIEVGWAVGVVVVLLCSVWLGMFAHKHMEYSHDLWWQVAFRADAPRFLRASVGAIGLALAFGVWQLLRPARPTAKPPSAEDLQTACRIARESPDTYAQLVSLGDKRLLFNDQRTAFVMFAIQGRSWVALGDPVGTPQAAPELILRLIEMADAYDDWAVFHQIDGEHLSWYADVGLTVVKIGEEARVPLTEFSLEGGARKPLRKTHNRFAKLNCNFEVIPISEVAALMPEIKTVSDAWLQAKAGHEKQFSMGWFEPDYLKQFPAAVIRQEDRIVAFANVICGGGQEELTVDLMRYVPDAPDDVMEELFIELLLWGKAQGYRWFNFGMAPLSGLQHHPLAPTWSRLGAALFRHGEEFYKYNFQGLRQFKQQFGPVWRPKYLAAHGGLGLPIVLANVASLINP